MEEDAALKSNVPPSKRQRSTQDTNSSSSGSSPSNSSDPPIMTLSSWTQKSCSSNASSTTGSTSSHCPPHRLLLLDLRPAADQRQRRLAGIHRLVLEVEPSLVIASLPLEEVKARSFELPARHVHFSILVQSDDDVQTAKQFLLQPDRVAANRNRKFRPWEVDGILVADELFWNEARDMNLIGGEGEGKNESEGTASSRIAVAPSPRLWDADGMVENVLLPLLQKEIAGANHPRKRWRIYDMASGAGRDAAFLAEELLQYYSSTRSSGAQFHVTAIDHRYNAKQTNIVQDFFQRRGVRDYTSVTKANLSKWETMRKLLLAARKAHIDGGGGGDDGTTSNDSDTTVAVLYCVRFLVRPAIKDLASCSTLREGTIFAISHFCIAKDGDIWPFDHPSPETVLERNEMKDLFMENGWDVLHDEIATDSDHGRTLLHFVARKG